MSLVMMLIGLSVVAVALGWRAARLRVPVPMRHPRIAIPEWSADHPACRHFEAEFTDPHPPAGAFDDLGGTVECSECGAEFPVGTPFCLDCGEATRDREEPAASMAAAGADETPEAEPHESSLECVYVATSPTEAVVLKGFLESHDIDCLTSGHVPSSVYHFTVSPLAEVRLLVRRTDAARARVLLAECR